MTSHAVAADRKAMDSKFLKEGERFDDLGDGRVIIQHPDKYCFTSDAIALANCVKAGSGDTVIDLGTGSGIIALLVAAQTKAEKTIGIDIQQDMIYMADRSAKANNMQDRVIFHLLKIQDAARHLGHESAAVVTVNPPYRKKGTGETSENASVRLSRSEEAVTLAEILTAAGKLLKFGGRFYMSHQTERLAEIFCSMRENKIEPKVLRFLTPQTLIVEGIKGGKEGLLCYF